VKLEKRIAPKIFSNHNETFVRDVGGKVVNALKKGHELKRKRLRLVKLEERIAPRIAMNHNETLVRDVA
jgi:hypothetical protein